MFFQKIRRSIKEVTSRPMEVNLKSMPAVKNLYLRVSESLQDKDKQLHSLNRAYKGAFIIIATISVVGHMVTLHITGNQRENAEITYAITNMHALVDTVVSQATVYKTSGEAFDDNLLTASLGSLKDERAKIETYGDESMNAIFQEAPFFLGNKINSFIDMTDDFLRFKRLNKHAEAAASFTVLTGETSRVLEINLDLALDKYHTDVIQTINRAQELQYAGVVTILIVLVLEALFIFGPLVQHLGEYHKYLIKLALTDMLTGLNNRRAFIQLANAGLDYYKRHKKPFTLVLMDLDHFKSVNDTYGHKVGDLVLQHYSALLQKTLRAHDTLGRIGGEEFAIFLPQITAEEALPLLERCRKRVAEAACSYVDGNGETKTLNYSSSFGAVAVGEGIWTLDDLFIRADEQLYKAKEQGRNCVVLKALKTSAAAA